MRLLRVLAAFSALFLFDSCTTGARSGAAEGAAIGGLASAAGSAVTAAIFGGNPAEAAMRGAVYGGTAGGVAGGIHGAQRDAAVAKQEAASRRQTEEELREQIGPDAFEGLAALAQCRHDEAFAAAERAKRSDNPNFSVAGWWLEVIAYADLRRENEARALFPELVELDWNLSDEAGAEARMREILNRLMDIREDYGLPRVCP